MEPRIRKDELIALAQKALTFQSYKNLKEGLKPLFAKRAADLLYVSPYVQAGRFNIRQPRPACREAEELLGESIITPEILSKCKELGYGGKNPKLNAENCIIGIFIKVYEMLRIGVGSPEEVDKQVNRQRRKSSSFQANDRRDTKGIKEIIRIKYDRTEYF